MFEPKLRYTHKKEHTPNGQNQGNKIDSDAAVRIGKRIPQWFIARLPDAMQGSAVEGARFKFSTNRRSFGHEPDDSQQLGKSLRGGGHQRAGHQARPWTQTDNRHTRRGGHPAGHRKRPFKHIVGQGTMGGRNGEDGLRGDAQAFFKRIGARFGRIRKRPKGKPSPQLYRHKLGELQELERLWCKGSIDLYYGDESHICEQTYVPCGWKFPKEDIHVPSQRGARLNCFAMIDRHCRTHWFMTEKSIDADTMVGFLDNFSLGIASFCHRILRNLTSRRFFGGCSRENGFNQKKDYLTADTLFYAANRALAAMGDGLMINFKYHAA